MNTQRISLPLLFTAFLTLACASCSYYVPATLTTSRHSDTLSVVIMPHGDARWDPKRDSLVVECLGCEAEHSRIVEHFLKSNDAQFEIAPTQTINLTLYSMGKKATVVVLPGIGTGDTGAAAPSMSNLPNRRRHSTPSTAPEETKKAKTEEPIVHDGSSAEKPIKTVTLKVTAPEGVAIYKDKTKKEVIKILPQGTVLTVLSREGDMLSVSIEGGEGFVEAEAVQIQD